MADEIRKVLSATFPDPPPFYKSFTTKNIRLSKQRLHDNRNSNDHDNTGTYPQPVSEPPAELRFLLPPEPPASATYRSFGAQYDVNEVLPALADQGIDPLYPFAHPSSQNLSRQEATWSLDRAFYIKKITKSILLNFLELIGILAVDAAEYGPKIDHFNTLFFNAHHLINEYRPHQARESLIMMMEAQLNKVEREVNSVKEMKERVERVLSGLESEDQDKVRPAHADIPQAVAESDAWRSEQQGLWEALHERSEF